MGELIRVVNPIAPEMQRILDKMPAARDVALRRVGLIVQNDAIRQANRIGSRPIPTRAQVNAYNRKGGGKKPRRIGGSGSPAWKRTGGLVQAIQSGLSATPGQVTLTADVPYALARHQLGVTSSMIGGPRGWVPKKPALGIVRRNPFFAEAIERTEPQIVPAFEAAFNNELNL